MSTIIWDNLAKNQDDPETIEQAIARLIVEHNNDVDAHNAPGQSLDLHRKNDIIDHPAGSVKNDKTSFHDFYYDLKWTDLTFWGKYNTAFNYSSGIYYLETGGVTQYSRLYRYFPNNWYRDNKQPTYYVSTKFVSENEPNPNMYFGFGFLSSSVTKDKTSGFVYKNNKFYASLVDVASGVVLQRIDYELIGVNLFDNVEHDLRFFHLASENKYQWFIDGQLVYEYQYTGDNYINVIDSPFGFDTDFTHNDNYEFIISIYDPVFSVDFTY